MSYAKVVATNTMTLGQWRNPENASSGHDGSQSSVHLEIPTGNKQWYTDAWVGRLKNLVSFDRVEDDISWDIAGDVMPKYLGDDMVILLGLTDTRVEELAKEETRHGSTVFHSLEKWNPKMRTGYRLVWAQCWGIPLIA